MSDELTITGDKLDLIKRTVAEGATDDELQLFLYTCRRTGLDPLTKQIYCIKRKGKMAIQTGIDGYRTIADRTGKYAGNDDPVYDSEQNPRKATVTVYKIVDGIRCAFTSSARWAQYYPGDSEVGFMWRKMPHLMLGKCAEALALRKAFPQSLSGIYTDEEMQQADRVEPLNSHEEQPVKNLDLQPMPSRLAPTQNKPLSETQTFTAKLENVLATKGVNKKTGKPYEKFEFIFDHEIVSASVFSKEFADKAVASGIRTGMMVMAQVERKGKFWNLLNIQLAEQDEEGHEHEEEHDYSESH